jgi:ubiquinone/menaquinone biosynthesis C-methylase UbiE
MVKQRIPETDHGITGKNEVWEFNEMQKNLRDKGFLVTDKIIKSGISYGSALEIGPGPGYLGLEWLSKTNNTNLTGLEISEGMKNTAQKNAGEYSLENRTKYVISDATKVFPFENNSFDAVFSNGSLHEWSNPIAVFNEISRVVKTKGRFLISDLKRNMSFIIKKIMQMQMTNKSEFMKEGLITSINAAYLKHEILELLAKSNLKDFNVSENPFGLVITGTV